ncbi:MAG TPA: hypothetical protein P5295_14085 [Spirochaetota bacterium]|nr:hypothetical protein [Spirochaetota bacterium]
MEFWKEKFLLMFPDLVEQAGAAPGDHPIPVGGHARQKRNPYEKKGRWAQVLRAMCRKWSEIICKGMQQ